MTGGVPVLRASYLYPRTHESVSNGGCGESESLPYLGGGLSGLVHPYCLAHLVSGRSLTSSSNA